MVRSFPISIIFVLASTIILVASKRLNNCGVGSHCSRLKTHSTRNSVHLKRHGISEGKARASYIKQRPDEETGSKRDNTFTDVLKNLLAKVDMAKGLLNKQPQAVIATSPTVKPISTPANVSNTTPAPTSSGPSTVTATPSPSSTSGATNAATSGSEATSPSPSTPTNSTSPTPATTVTPSSNATCNMSSGQCVGVKPTRPGRYNITIAPGVVLTPNGEIILGPQFPILIGGGHTHGGQTYPGVSPGAGRPPGIVSIPSHQGALAQQGPCINKDSHCIEWASKGECSKNPPFMIANCRRSCTNCAKCENEESQCVEWAKDGQCSKNRPFMEQKCWRSCSKCAPCVNKLPAKCIYWEKNGQCSKNRNFMEKQCWKSCSGCAKCENKQDGCIEWAASGQCFKTPQFMLLNCWKSCSFCAPCVDKHPNKCPLWAKHGECKTNRKFMEENCWKSCSKCCKDKKKHCASWAKDGECSKNPDFMNENCAKSCNKC